ncbi:2Fe-2S iron-sulfur cluster-binding protein [Frigoriflavimonas asaccharolytica]|uniref:Ring-1,2-phenylacetyl-CoA epoxidase subunit PaaE n=1 Tax=Frigoriflavimonas asaccharolytica TaxID=2735899 RepID=A0A8J8G7X5_9FLAO|nr:2Fe-2S iron-sulfur cluster-binding protein [Frigoriflavimonas asaccharolytica]NRS93133.1 ring-1,2-phenylacetyl-CoA epoxidase subunit PaaE [Frigoriflavimonas asaccharolytica]
MERKVSEIFNRLKIVKKEQITKSVFVLEFEIPLDFVENYQFLAGQYVTLKFLHNGNVVEKDFSMTNAPQEKNISLAIKFSDENSASSSIFQNYKTEEYLEVSLPKGRFTINSKPHEFRTIVALASGIGITPIFSHIKNLINTEPRTRIFLFYGNKNSEEAAFKNELDLLVSENENRFEVHYFYSQKKGHNPFYEGRLTGKKMALIINQIMMLDDTDEEATLWDAVDEVLICGKGEMIKSLANACYHHGIRKENIHFELFEAYNEDIYPVEKEFPLLENIEVEFILNNKTYKTLLENNNEKLLPQLLEQGFDVPYSCKSGICGTCECHLENGQVELLENEYLTEKEVEKGNILTCMSIVLSKELKINFDTI